MGGFCTKAVMSLVKLAWRKCLLSSPQIHVSLEGLISNLLRNSLQNMLSWTVLWLQTMVLGEGLFWFIKTVLSGIQQVQQGNVYIIKALSHLFCSVDVGYLVGWRDEAVSSKARKAVGWQKSRQVVPGVDGNLLSNTGRSVTTTCLQVVGMKQTLLWDA